MACQIHTDAQATQERTVHSFWGTSLISRALAASCLDPDGLTGPLSLLIHRPPPYITCTCEAALHRHCATLANVHETQSPTDLTFRHLGLPSAGPLPLVASLRPTGPLPCKHLVPLSQQKRQKCMQNLRSRMSSPGTYSPKVLARFCWLPCLFLTALVPDGPHKI